MFPLLESMIPLIAILRESIFTISLMFSFTLTVPRKSTSVSKVAQYSYGSYTALCLLHQICIVKLLSNINFPSPLRFKIGKMSEVYRMILQGAWSWKPLQSPPAPDQKRRLASRRRKHLQNRISRDHYDAFDRLNYWRSTGKALLQLRSLGQ